MENAKEKLPVLRNVVWLTAFILFFELGMLAWKTPGKSAFHWITFGVIAITAIYLVAICLKLIKELDGKSKNDKKF